MSCEYPQLWEADRGRIVCNQCGASATQMLFDARSQISRLEDERDRLRRKVEELERRPVDAPTRDFHIGRDCSCHIMAPCHWCETMTEEELER